MVCLEIFPFSSFSINSKYWSEFWAPTGITKRPLGLNCSINDGGILAAAAPTIYIYIYLYIYNTQINITIIVIKECQY